MAKTRQLIGDKFSIMCGDDDITYDIMTNSDIHANGVISVISNITPAPLCRMVNAILDGDMDTATKIYDVLAPLFGTVTVRVSNERVLASGKRIMVTDKYRNPLPIKTLMSGLGMPSGPCRRPLGKMSEAGIKKVRDAAISVWQKAPEFLTPIKDFYGVDIEARLFDDSVWNNLK